MVLTMGSTIENITPNLLKEIEESLETSLRDMSERVRTFITEEMEFQGPMRLSEVEEIPTAHRATGSPTRGTRPGNYRSRRF